MDPREAFRAHGGSNTPFFALTGRACHARVVSVYDGDTVTLVLPVHDAYYKFHARIYGIDTSEIKSKLPEARLKAVRARARLLQLLGVPVRSLEDNPKKTEVEKFLEENVVVVYVVCRDWDKYGRALVDCYLAECKTQNVADILVKEGLAYPYFGGSKLAEEEQVAA